MRKMLFPDYKIMLVLGDMRELGSQEEVEHRRISGIVSQAVDELFLVGKSTKKFTMDEIQKIGFPSKNIRSFVKSTDAGDEISKFLSKATDKYLIIFKGSQNTIYLEEAIKKLLPTKFHHQLTRQSKDWLETKKLFFS